MKICGHVFLHKSIPVILFFGTLLLFNEANAFFTPNFPWNKKIILTEEKLKADDSDPKAAKPDKPEDEVVDTVIIEFSQTEFQAQHAAGKMPLSDEELKRLQFQTLHGAGKAVDHVLILSEPETDSEATFLPNDETNTFTAIAFALLAALQPDFPEGGDIQSFASNSHVGTQKETHTIQISLPSDEVVWPQVDIAFSMLNVSAFTAEFRLNYRKSGSEQSRVFKLIFSLVALPELYNVVKNEAWFRENRRRDDEDDDEPPSKQQADDSKEGTPQPNGCQTLCGWGGGGTSQQGGGSNGGGNSDCGEEKSLIDHVVEHSVKSRVHHNTPSRVVSW